MGMLVQIDNLVGAGAYAGGGDRTYEKIGIDATGLGFRRGKC